MIQPIIIRGVLLSAVNPIFAFNLFNAKKPFLKNGIKWKVTLYVYVMRCAI